MLAYYSDGSKTEYLGGRKIDQLKSFAEKASEPYVLLSFARISILICVTSGRYKK